MVPTSELHACEPIIAGGINPEREPKRLSELLTAGAIAAFMGLPTEHVAAKLAQAGGGA